VEHFVTLERAIACPNATVAGAAETAAQVLVQAGYRRGLGFGPTSSYVRARRPTWALVLAVVGAIPTLGLALLLLLVKTKDHCNVVIEDGPYGVVALVSGRVPASLPAALEAADEHYLGGVPEAPHGGPMPPPMLLTPDGGEQMGEQFHSPQAILRPAVQSPSPPDGGSPFPVPGAYASNAGQQGGDGPFGSYGRPPMHSPVQARHPRQAEPFPMPGVQPPLPQPSQAQSPFDPEEYEPTRQASPPIRPPSRLAPPPPGAAPGRNGVPAGASAGPGGPAAGPGSPARPPHPGQPVGAPAPGGPNVPAAPAASGSGPDDDSISSTSGRVPWAVAGGRLSTSPPPVPGAPPASAPPASAQPAPSAHQPASPVPVGRSGASGPARPAPAVPVAAGGAPDPGRPREQAAAVATADDVGVPVLRVDSGELLEVGPFCLLGREPAVRDGDPSAQMVRFDDPKLSVSKTHLAYGVDAGGLWVIDRNSTNGTTLIDPSGQRTPCSAGVRRYVPVGWQIQIGQRRITVEPPPGAASGS
jgi:diadenosine tetraphosphatase ApaH/serine/threonine PP2A family protein phosphatase